MHDPHDLARHIREIPDFPAAGVGFKDLTPLLADHQAFTTAITELAKVGDGGTIDLVVGMESRGFLLGAPVALHLGVGFIPARKPGKLPGPTRARSFALEYGSAQLEIHVDGIRKDQRVLIVDDVLATGGTALATAQLVEDLGGTVAGFAFLMELVFLDGAKNIAAYPFTSLIRYP
ncbi:MAG: adenine phosphoribosyltransferase [Nitriliruptoraceae bacterium]